MAPAAGAGSRGGGGGGGEATPEPAAPVPGTWSRCGSRRRLFTPDYSCDSGADLYWSVDTGTDHSGPGKLQELVLELPVMPQNSQNDMEADGNLQRTISKLSVKARMLPGGCNSTSLQ